jgi:hypothetical protein
MMKSMNRLMSDSHGGVTVEFVLILPLFLAFFVLSFTTVDVLKEKSTAVKASYSSGDLISRQTTLDNAFLDQVHSVFRSITRAKSDDTWMRITSVTQSTNDEILVDWSYATGEGAQGPLDQDESDWHVNLPDLVIGETIIYVETYLIYKPTLTAAFLPIKAIMKERMFENRQIVPLRFTEQLVNSDFPLAFNSNIHNDGTGSLP